MQPRLATQEWNATLPSSPAWRSVLLALEVDPAIRFVFSLYMRIPWLDIPCHAHSHALAAPKGQAIRFSTE